MVSHGPERKSPFGVMPERGAGMTMCLPDFPSLPPGICGARFLRQQEAGVSNAGGVCEGSSGLFSMPPDGRCHMTTKGDIRRPSNEGKNEAERAGFEPATRLSTSTRFPVALLRPLGHLSAPRAD